MRGSRCSNDRDRNSRRLRTADSMLAIACQNYCSNVFSRLSFRLMFTATFWTFSRVS
ncbi:MAG TPA: hypothetical protein V6D14_34565 [Coleofasciculaceae cyanobacterium]